MSELFKAMTVENNSTETENGCPAYKSTLDSLLDLFASGASCRSDSKRLKSLVRKAYSEDKLFCICILFYFRDIRGNGGQGERNIFREGMKELIDIDPKTICKVLRFIPFYGRWDDLIALYGIERSISNHIAEIIKFQINEDIQKLDKGSSDISLCAKWLPSCNTSSKHTKAIANKIRREVFGMDEKSYRKMLSRLRKAINIIESYLSKKEYKFDYSQVPGQAALKYRKAFARNDNERYTEYLNSLANGKAKVNSKTLYPYEIIRKVRHTYDDKELALMDQMWKALPNYFGREDHANWLAVVDVSGSMTCHEELPMNCSISLGLYIAERNMGVFQNKFITFSSEPYLVNLNPEDKIKRKVTNIEDNPRQGLSTNLYAVFELVLNTAIKHHIPKEEMPEVIVVISDMQFDHQRWPQYVMDSIKKMFRNSEYECPKLVYWNVAADYKANQPVTKNDQGAIIINGCKPGMFELILQGKNPEQFMESVINSERYKVITI